MDNSKPKVSRPQLLVSVRNAVEIEAAVEGGADWIDLKEPSAGPLAGVSAEVARECAEVLAGRRPLSAALGELLDWPTSSVANLLEIPEIAVVKLGLAGCADCREWQRDWLEVAREVTACEKQLVAVIYADWRQARAPSPGEVLDFALASECGYLLIDTFDKRGGGTEDYLSRDEISQICEAGRQGLMKTVLAGSLTLAAIDSLLLEHVDVVAVRGAVCSGERTGSVELELVREFSTALALPESANPLPTR